MLTLRGSGCTKNVADIQYICPKLQDAHTKAHDDTLDLDGSKGVPGTLDLEGNIQWVHFRLGRQKWMKIQGVHTTLGRKYRGSTLNLEGNIGGPL